jgi:GntR family transcriptional regulator
MNRASSTCTEKNLHCVANLYIVCIQMTNRRPPPVLRVDLAAPIPVYRQILDGLRASLVSGSFAPGDRLPTVRELAIDLGVNHNTVAEAYRLLAEEGWLDLRRYRGAVVRRREVQKAHASRREEFAQRLKELTARAIADGIDLQSVAEQLTTRAHDLEKGAL